MQDMNFNFAQMSNLNEKELLSSSWVAVCAAKAEKPHTIAENLILPATLDIAEFMFGKQEVKKLKSIPLSDNAIQRRKSNRGDRPLRSS